MADVLISATLVSVCVSVFVPLNAMEDVPTVQTSVLGGVIIDVINSAM